MRVVRRTDVINRFASSELSSSLQDGRNTATTFNRYIFGVDEISIKFYELSRAPNFHPMHHNTQGHVAPRSHTREAADPAPFVTRQISR